MTDQFAEESWESEIGSMLGSMPTIDPPEGFIAEALDHRPLHAGRTLAGVFALCIAAMTLATITGAVGRSEVTLEPYELADQHTAVEASVLGTGSAGGESGYLAVDDYIETPVVMPDGFERAWNFAADDFRQAVYERDEESVSVFVGEGVLDWDALPREGLTEIQGHRAWVDPARKLTVVQAEHSIVTVVGLAPEQVGEILEIVPHHEPGIWDRAEDTAVSIARQLGYPDLG